MKKQYDHKKPIITVMLNKKPLIINGKIDLKKFLSFRPIVKKCILVNKKVLLKKKFSVKENNLKNKKKWLMYPLGFLIGFVNGFWGGGGGMLCVPTLSNVFNLDEKTSHATALLVMLPLSVFSLVLYLVNNTLTYENLWLVVGAFFVGGIIGALLLKRVSNTFLRIAFGIIVIIAGVRMLF